MQNNFVETLKANKNFMIESTHSFNHDKLVVDEHDGTVKTE
jgi:hypothetical protein